LDQKNEIKVGRGEGFGGGEEAQSTAKGKTGKVKG